MRLFYRAMLWLAELELAIARSTGRNPADLPALRADVGRWEHALLMTELNA
jgi:hypothetical protein